MQLTHFQIKDLFGRFNHSFRLKSEPIDQPSLLIGDDPSPSVVILHGINGVGKTTVLRMLDGILRLDFNIFRAVPFSSCTLMFNTGDQITVAPVGIDKKRGPKPIKISFRDHEAFLHPLHSGPYKEEDARVVEEFRNDFNASTEEIHFQLIDTLRFLQRRASEDYGALIRLRHGISEDERHDLHPTLTGFQRSLAALRSEQTKKEERIRLADHVKDFMSRAQADYQTFFAMREPDLFARIISQLDQTDTTSIDPNLLRRRLIQVQEWDDANERLGLRSDRWNLDQLNEILSRDDTSQEALNVLAAYVEVLESRAVERNLIADRLSRFEQLMDQFYEGISVKVSMKDGFRILSEGGERLHEEQLSSGEYHLLYLMVTALTTRRRGSVIAIDEPELSMHIGWQRKLVRGLVECAEGAEPQFIFATHSPDLAAEFRASMVRLGPEPITD